MIFLNKNQNNNIFLSLSQDTLLSGLTDNYILSIYSTQQQIPFTLNLTDISTKKNRYNQFTVSGTILSGITNGYYNYKVYNTAYSANTIEIGKIIITGTTQVMNKYINANNTIKKYIDNNGR